MIATRLSVLLRHFFSLVVFGGGGMPIRKLELTVPCARAHLWDAWHFKTLQAGLGGSRGCRVGQQGTAAGYRSPQPLLACQGPEV